MCPVKLFLQVKHPFLSLLETVFGLASSSVIYCDQWMLCNTVISDLPPTAVGLAVRDQFVLVSVPFRGQIEVFDENMGFARVKEIELNSGPDNLKFVGDDLWIGSHPSLWSVILHLNGPVSCPSQVLVVRDALSGNAKVHVELQQAEGNPVAGVSTALLNSGYLLLGTMRDGFAICTRPVQTK